MGSRVQIARSVPSPCSICVSSHLGSEEDKSLPFELFSSVQRRCVEEPAPPFMGPESRRLHRSNLLEFDSHVFWPKNYIKILGRFILFALNICLMKPSEGIYPVRTTLEVGSRN